MGSGFMDAGAEGANRIARPIPFSLSYEFLGLCHAKLTKRKNYT
jgi:hypothetical protein